MKKKPGPKPKPKEFLVRKFGISVASDMGDFLDEMGGSSVLIQEFISESSKYQKWLNLPRNQHRRKNV